MIELVWDERRVGTATTSDGHSLTVGEQAAFSPDELLAMAAAACLMRTCIRLADTSGIELLSFTATAEAAGDCTSGHAPKVDLRVHLVVSDRVPAPHLSAFWTRAVRQSPIAMLLGPRLAIHHDITRLAQNARGGNDR